MTDDELRFDEFPPATIEAWRAAVDRVLKGADFERQMVSRSDDGLRVEPLYTEDGPEPGVPGAAPFVRGTRTLARWTIEQRQAHPDPATANRQTLDDLARGVEAIRLAIADPVAARPEGIALVAPDDLETLLDGVFTELAPVSLEAGSRAVPMARALLRIWAERGDPPDRLAGDLHVDPVGALLRTGRLPGGLDHALHAACDLVADVAQRLPRVRALGIDLRLPHDAGASPALEIATALAQLAWQLRAFDQRGLAPDTVAAATTLLVPVDDDVFTGIAKLRALRRCWSTLVGACTDAVPPPRIVAETSRRMLARRDPWVNLLRNTVAGFAGGVGGADAVTVLPFTAPLGLPDRSARRMARNTQLVLLDEASLGHVVDPAGGSFYVDHLTGAIAEAAWQHFQALEAAGGFLAVLESGRLLDEIATVRAAREHRVRTRRLRLTGVSAFPLLDERAVELDPVDAGPLLARLPRPEPTADDLLLGPWPRHRLAEPFEALRDRADARMAANGRRPTALLLQLGPLAEHAARSGWTRALLAAGGIDAVDSGPLADADAVATACSDTPSPLAVLCASDARYAELAEAAAGAAKASGIRHLRLAGRPGEAEAALRAAGVDGFLHDGIDVAAGLATMHDLLAAED